MMKMKETFFTYQYKVLKKQRGNLDGHLQTGKLSIE